MGRRPKPLPTKDSPGYYRWLIAENARKMRLERKLAREIACIIEKGEFYKLEPEFPGPVGPFGIVKGTRKTVEQLITVTNLKSIRRWGKLKQEWAAYEAAKTRYIPRDPSFPKS